ncbi:AraC family transcriptional regulator [Erysipelothrix rhusiopathiae SY1027]|nr:GyrI-like domain-containing protein [Erysipelothrix rhusiopathiae]AGN25152.1 AraC family transcriptional regulator [Erysipelothrix rhusiopathiae SY1027]
MKMRIEEKESVNIAGYQKTFSYENGANLKQIPMFWDEINQSAKDLDLFKMNDHKIEGIVGLCQQASDGFMTYLIGTSCDFQEGLVNVELPKSRWLVFDAVGALPQSVQNTWRDIVSLYLPTCSEEIDGSMDLEVYSQEDPNSESLVTEIWLRIKA